MIQFEMEALDRSRTILRGNRVGILTRVEYKERGSPAYELEDCFKAHDPKEYIVLKAQEVGKVSVLALVRHCHHYDVHHQERRRGNLHVRAKGLKLGRKFRIAHRLGRVHANALVSALAFVVTKRWPRQPVRHFQLEENRSCHLELLAACDTSRHQ